MKKRILILIALLSLLYSVQSQTITDTASLRTYINSNIVPNAAGSITAVKMNNVLNGIASLMKAYAVDSAWWLAPDTLVLGRRGGFASYKVRIAISPAGAETDPTVSAAAKAITSGDVTNWNSKQAALSGSSTISIIANVISAANTTALWNANQLQGRSVSSTAPTTSQVLSWDGSAWSPATVTGAADGNNYTTGNTFNTGTGILTQTRSGLSSITVDLDGRYFDAVTRIDSITRWYKDGVLIYADTLFTTNLQRPLYAVDQYTIGLKNDTPIYNANKIQDRPMASTAPTDGQAIVWDNGAGTWKPGTVSGGGSQSLQSVLGIGNKTGIQIIDTSAANQFTGWSGEPNNLGTSYGSYGLAGKFNALGWSRHDVNGSGRPNVVGLMWGYNTTPDGGRVSTSEAGFRFGTETHFETGGEKLFELHLPEFIDTAGVYHRLFSAYIDKTGKRANAWNSEGDGIAFSNWGNQNSTWGYISPGTMVSYIYKNHSGAWPVMSIGANAGLTVNGVSWGTKYNYFIQTTGNETIMGKVNSVTADVPVTVLKDNLRIGDPYPTITNPRSLTVNAGATIWGGELFVNNNAAGGTRAALFQINNVSKFQVGNTFTELYNDLYSSKGGKFTDGVAVGALSPNIVSPGIALELKDTLKTSLFTNLKTDKLVLLTPQAGMFHFNTDSTEFQFFNGTAWQVFASRKWVRDQGYSTGTTYTFNNGLTNTAGTVKLGGALDNAATSITGGGSGSSLTIGGGSGLNTLVLNTTNATQVIGAFAITGGQSITSGTSGTVADAVSKVYINPGSVLASYTLTLPASPVDGEELKIFFGGTIAGGATVVTSLTISANTGQTLMQSTTPTTAIGGDCIIYSFLSSNNTWYRVK